MSTEGPVYTAVALALNGLIANPATSGKVEAIVREHSSGGQTVPYPHLFVEVVGDEHQASSGFKHYAVTVRVHLFYNRDQDGSQAASDAILVAVHAALEDVTMAAVSGWSFSRLNRMRTFRGPSTEHHGHRIAEYELVVTEIPSED